MKERWTEAPDGGQMRVLYDGEEKFRGTSNECFVWLGRHGNHSIHYEVTWGHYTVEPVPPDAELEEKGDR